MVLGPVEPWEGGLVNDLLLLGQCNIAFRDHKRSGHQNGVNTLVWGDSHSYRTKDKVAVWEYLWPDLGLSYALTLTHMCSHCGVTPSVNTQGWPGCQREVLYPMAHLPPLITVIPPLPQAPGHVSDRPLGWPCLSPPGV